MTQLGQRALPEDALAEPIFSPSTTPVISSIACGNSFIEVFGQRA